MRKDGTTESSRGFHFAGILLIICAVIAGLALSLLVVFYEQTTRVEARAAAKDADAPAPVMLFTTPTPPVVYVAVPQAAAVATSTAVPTPTTVPASPAPASTAAPTSPASAPRATAVTSSATSTSSPAAAQKQAGGDAAAGATVFANMCGSCHPGGQAGLGPAIKGLPADVIKATVRSGKGIMPPFGPGNVSDQQLLDIIAFLDKGS